MTEKGRHRILCYRIPEGVQVEAGVVQSFETSDGIFEFVYPNLSTLDIVQTAQRLQQASLDYLGKLTVDEIIERIDQAAQKWLLPDYPQRRLAELLLPLVTGYDAETVRLQLKRYMRTFRKKELLRFVEEEFDNPGLLDDFRPRKSGGFSRAYGPDLIFHVFSGNVPGISIWSLVMGLLLKSAQLGKTSSAEPLMAVWFAESLAEVDERMAASIAILPWKGGTAELEEPAIEAADAVIAYGGSSAVESIRAKMTSSKRFLAFGHKISFAMVAKEALTPDRVRDTIAKLAEDIAIYDQMSCMSPQSVFVESGGAVDPGQFTQLLAVELENLQVRRPRAVLTDEEALSIRSARNRYRLEEINDSEVTVYESTRSTSWTVISHARPGFEGSPLNRTVHIFACGRLEEGIPSLRKFQPYLQSCGLAVDPVRLFELSPLLGKAGVNRICPLGAMNQAKAGWHHDGRFNLLDLVRFVDIERGTEELAEQYDADVE